MNTFRIVYDDQPDDVVEKISKVLQKYGLTIEYGDGDEGYQEYEIIKLEE